MRKPKICMVLPELLTCSGITQISLTQIKYCPVEWTGVFVRWNAIDQKMAEEFLRYAPIYGAGKYKSDLILDYETEEEAIRAASKDADIIYSTIFYRHSYDNLPPIALTFQASAVPMESYEDFLSGNHNVRWFSAGSQASADVLKKFGLKDVFVNRNSVDLDRIKTIKGRRAQRWLWGLREGEIAVGVIGRHHWEKNPSAVIRSLKYMSDGFKAVYYGDDTHTHSVNKELVQMAEYMAPGRVQFHLPASEIGDILAGLDVLVLASHREGLPIVLLEAMASGVPVVATRVGGISDIEQEYGDVCVFLDADPSAHELADAIQKAVGEGSAARIERAKELARGPFSAETSCQRWGEYFSSLAKKQAKIMLG